MLLTLTLFALWQIALLGAIEIIKSQIVKSTLASRYSFYHKLEYYIFLTVFNIFE